MSRGFQVACAGLLAAIACLYYFAPFGLRPGVAPRPVLDPLSQKKLEIFKAATGRPSDPAPAAMYAEINARHFGGALPAIPVVWTDALEELDRLVGDDTYHLEGMTNGSLVLVSRTLKDDEEELRRTVCHEAVHVKLHPVAGRKANHGDGFQAELRRIFEEGCFVAILASDADKHALRDWIEQQKARLTEEQARLDEERSRIDQERADIERAIADMNARIETANAQRSGWPGDEEQQALRARRERALQEAGDYNVTLERHNADAEALNREIERYRLMMAYPHGIDDEAGIKDPPQLP